MAYIRPYQPSDEDAVLHVFRDTASPDLRANPDPDVLHVGSFLWCRPYITLNPDWCWVLDDGKGTAVGYIICAPDTSKFADDYRSRFFPVVKTFGIENPDSANPSSGVATLLKRDVYTPENMLHADFPNLLKHYPAHLHIDILSSHQSQNWGPKLIDTLLSKLKAEKIPGVHLGMAYGNDRAGRFYDRLGFLPFTEMNDGGEAGKKGGAIYRVKSTA